MTEPPYSKEDNQRPKYIEEMFDIYKFAWTGSPLFSKKMYVVKVSAPQALHTELESKVGVEVLDEVSQAKKNNITAKLKIAQHAGDSKGFINFLARCEGNKDWDSEKLGILEFN